MENLKNGQSLPQHFTNAKFCFVHFDQDKDGKLNFQEFVALTRELFCNENNAPHPVEESKLKHMFDIFSGSNSDGINYAEFEVCWKNWISKILRPVSAFVIVDVQNDFVSGSLSLSKGPLGENGAEVVEPINELLDNANFDHVLFSLDWHPQNHISFASNAALRKFDASSKIQNAADVQVNDVVVFEGNPPKEQILWPAHAVQNSWGAKLHEKLKVPEGSTMIYKGTNPEVDSYSAFWDNQKLAETNLNSELKAKGVTDVYLCGLAYDLCVGQSALHANEHGYRTVLIEDACRAFEGGRKECVKSTLTAKYGLNEQCSRIKPLVEGRDRRPELGYKLALELQKNN